MTIRLRADLHNYQRAAAQFIRDNPRCALFIDMGLGKTASTLTAFRDLAADFEITRGLVIGPPRVVSKTWPNEVAEWAHTRGLTYTVVTGTPKRRLELLRKPTDLHLISCDSVKWLVEMLAQRKIDFRWDTCIVDESSKFKTPSSQRFKELRRIAAFFDRFVILTGTPAPNGLYDLWSQIYLLDQGQRLGATQKAFKDRWFTYDPTTGKTLPRKHAPEQIQNAIRDICFTLRSDDYLQLPERIENIIEVELPDDVMQTYKKFEREYVLSVTEGVNIEAITAATLTNKLLQLANGVVYDAEKNQHEFHKQKIEALRDIVDEAQGEPVLVAYNFKSDLRQILATFPQAKVLGKDNALIDEWNAGKVPMMLAHPQSAGHGLNLQFGGHIAVWYALTWSLEAYQQFNKRLHRQGQTRPVLIHHLIARNTADRVVFQALQRKDATQNALLDALKARIADILRAA